MTVIETEIDGKFCQRDEWTIVVQLNSSAFLDYKCRQI